MAVHFLQNPTSNFWTSLKYNYLFCYQIHRPQIHSGRCSFPMVLCFSYRLSNTAVQQSRKTNVHTLSVEQYQNI